MDDEMKKQSPNPKMIVNGATVLSGRKRNEIIGKVTPNFHAGETLTALLLIFGFVVVFGAVNGIVRTIADATISRVTSGNVITGDASPSLILLLLGSVAVGVVMVVYGRIRLKRSGGINSFFACEMIELPPLSQHQQFQMSSGIQYFVNEQKNVIANTEEEHQQSRTQGILGLIVFLISCLVAMASQEIILFISVILAAGGLLKVIFWQGNEMNLLGVYISRQLHQASLFEKLVTAEAQLSLILEQQKKAEDLERSLFNDENKEKKKIVLMNMADKARQARLQLEKAQAEEETEPEVLPGDREDPEDAIDSEKKCTQIEEEKAEEHKEEHKGETIEGIPDEVLRTNSNTEEDWAFWDTFYHR